MNENPARGGRPRDSISVMFVCRSTIVSPVDLPVMRINSELNIMYFYMLAEEVRIRSDKVKTCLSFYRSMREPRHGPTPPTPSRPVPRPRHVDTSPFVASHNQASLTAIALYFSAPPPAHTRSL